jgi:hypothetical protein
MINAKRVFRNILREWGHDILLQRRLSDDNIYSEKLERITTRHSTTASRFLSSAKQEEREGVVINSERVYYFESEINPKPGDRVYEGSFSSLQDYTLYVLEDCYPVRGRYGKVEYWMCGATKEE